MENDEIMDSLLDDQITGDSASEDEVDTIGDEDEVDHSDEIGPIGDDEIDDSMMIKDDEISPDDEISDIFAISVDTRTNTVRDILPVPPMNAADAVAGDSDAKLDTGFGAESGDMNPMDGFLDESGIYYRGNSGHRFLFEGIDDGSGSSSDAPDMGDTSDAPAPDSDSSSDNSSSDSGEESEVTTAVKQDLEEKDKESSEEDTIGDDDIPSTDGLDSSDSSSTDDSSSSGSNSSNAEIKDQLKLVNDINKKVSDLRDRLIDKFQ